VVKIVDSIIKRGINQLYVLGGNGTHAGGAAIYAECVRRKYVCAVVGVPKTIDNDILLIDKTFGFDTAVEEAQRALRAASIEAKSAYRGVGVVKLVRQAPRFVRRSRAAADGPPVGLHHHVRQHRQRRGGRDAHPRGPLHHGGADWRDRAPALPA